jgi:hypothetical protein
MKVRIIAVCCFFCLSSLSVMAQKKTTAKTSHNTKSTTQTTTPKVPQSWQQSPYNVYMPDYYAFYDPHRNGFVYWTGEKWTVSQESPAMLKDVDLGNTRVQILKDETLTYPENNFEQYMKLYPPQQIFPSVPVPIITITNKK